MTRLTKQKAKLEELLAGIGAFNAKSRAAKIAALLDKYIPAVEQMHSTMKKYQVAFTETTVENKKLKQENGKLNEALNTEREAAEHWKEEFHKEQAFRLSTEGRIMREVNNLLRYDGTANGQEELSDE